VPGILNAEEDCPRLTRDRRFWPSWASQWMLRVWPGAPRRVGAAGAARPARSVAGLGAAQRRRLMEIRANSAREPEIDGFCSSQRSRFVVAGSARRGRTPGDGWS
jgi:hypothetical protein